MSKRPVAIGLGVLEPVADNEGVLDIIKIESAIWRLRLASLDTGDDQNILATMDVVFEDGVPSLLWLFDKMDALHEIDESLLPGIVIA